LRIGLVPDWPNLKTTNPRENRKRPFSSKKRWFFSCFLKELLGSGETNFKGIGVKNPEGNPKVGPFLGFQPTGINQPVEWKKPQWFGMEVTNQLELGLEPRWNRKSQLLGFLLGKMVVKLGMEPLKPKPEIGSGKPDQGNF